MNNLIAITIGDIKGIGIHLLIKEWKRKRIKNFVIITNLRIFKSLKLVNLHNVNVINSQNDIFLLNRKKLNILNFETKNQFTNSLESLKIAYNLVKKKICIGILTLPLNKNKINKFADMTFIDHTSFFSNLENNKNSNMMFIHDQKFFIPLTTHIELKNVYKSFINKEAMIKKIENINATIKNDFKIKLPKLLISGINPHSGENGLISNDESKYLIPIIRKLKNKNINITGPISGDGLLSAINFNKYDAFIFTYHDQALIPFKIISKFEGVNFTSNLNIIRVTPSHGTAVELINNKKANSKGIVNCFNIINKISKNRRLN